MKKSIVVSTQQTKFSALAYQKDLKKIINKVAELGFDGAELAVRDPKSLDTEKVVQIVKESGLEVPAIGTGQAWGDEGLSFSDPNEMVRKMAVDRIIEQIKFASLFNSQVIIGLIRGIIKEGITRKEAEEWTISCLRECAEFAQDKKITLTLEPVNRYESNLINTIQDGIDFIKRVGVPGVGLLVDTFHMNIEEVSIYDSIIKAKNDLTHVHFADSNRWAPGCGHLDFRKVVETLKNIDYTGYVSAEILPLPDQEAAAEMTIKTMNQLSLS